MVWHPNRHVSEHRNRLPGERQTRPCSRLGVLYTPCLVEASAALLAAFYSRFIVVKEKDDLVILLKKL